MCDEKLPTQLELETFALGRQYELDDILAWFDTGCQGLDCDLGEGSGAWIVLAAVRNALTKKLHKRRGEVPK
jgi:hypothetical protein